MTEAMLNDLETCLTKVWIGGLLSRREYKFAQARLALKKMALAAQGKHGDK